MTTEATGWSKAGDHAARWCILRTSGPSTMRLARKLAEDGVEAWTPVMMKTRRQARARERVRVEVAMMPTFVFARACHMADLQNILGQPKHPYPVFSIFRHAGATPLIKDRELEKVRACEERLRLAELKTKRRTFGIGSEVRVEDPSWVGMTGIVEASDGKAARINFGGGFVVTIGAWLLHTNELRKAA